jgi:soluble lytic murein transglycosylase-like protein
LNTKAYTQAATFGLLLAAGLASASVATAGESPRFASSTEIRQLIAQVADEAGIPADLADAVVRIESRYDPRARSRTHFGLMQISLPTARSLGYAGGPDGLLDARTNLTFGLRYLAKAYELAGGDTCGTVLRYQAGHRATSMTKAARAYCTKVQEVTLASALH